MAEIANCPRCNALFMKNQVSTICQACFKKEEEAYEVVYAFLRKRENRAATMQRITEATGVEEWLLAEVCSIRSIKGGAISPARLSLRSVWYINSRRKNL